MKSGNSLTGTSVLWAFTLKFLSSVKSTTSLNICLGSPVNRIYTSTSGKIKKNWKLSSTIQYSNKNWKITNTKGHHQPSLLSIFFSCNLDKFKQVVSILSSLLAKLVDESSSVVKVVEFKTAPLVVTHLMFGCRFLSNTKAFLAASPTLRVCSGSDLTAAPTAGVMPPRPRPSSSPKTEKDVLKWGKWCSYDWNSPTMGTMTVYGEFGTLIRVSILSRWSIKQFVSGTKYLGSTSMWTLITDWARILWK